MPFKLNVLPEKTSYSLTLHFLYYCNLDETSKNNDLNLGKAFDGKEQGKERERRREELCHPFPLFSRKLREEVSICQRLDIISYIVTHGAIMVPCHR